MLRKMMQEKENRIMWVDNLKALGILAIFSGHMGIHTGHLYPFVFTFHVPLLFFAAGLFAKKNEKLGFKDVVKKKCNQILLPYFFLVVVNMIVLVLIEIADFITYIKYVKQFIWGIRNQLPAGGMWFFSCLFCTEIIFEVLRRIIKKKYLLLLMSLVIYLITITLLPNSPIVTPSWFFNLDSALYYLVFYTIGYVVSDFLLEKQMTDRSRVGFTINCIGILLLFFYIYSVYMGQDFVGNLINSIPVLGLFYPIVRAMLIIMGCIVVAKAFERSEIIGYVGSQTLWLCGNESVIKHIMQAAAGILGFSIEIKSALAAVVYSCILIWLILRVLASFEKKVFDECITYIK